MLSGAILGVLGGFWAVLGVFWEVWCSQKLKKHKCMFSKSFDIAMFALSERFGRPSWLILARFGPRKMSQILKNWSHNQ